MNQQTLDRQQLVKLIKSGGPFDTSHMEYAARNATLGPDTKVVILRVGKWTKVGSYTVFLNAIHADMEKRYIEALVIRRDVRLVWLRKIVTRVRYSKTHITLRGLFFEGTNIVVDVFSAMDGETKVVLAAEAQPK